MTGSSVSDLLLFHRSNCSHIFWTVTPLFQKVICSDLSFILLKDLVVLSNNHLQSSLLSWYWFDFTTLVAAIRTWITLFLLQKSSRSHKIFKIYCFFFFRKAVAVKRYHNYQVWYLFGFRHVFIDSLFLTASITVIHFFLWYCHYFTGTLEAIRYIK